MFDYILSGHDTDKRVKIVRHGHKVLIQRTVEHLIHADVDFYRRVKVRAQDVGDFVLLVGAHIIALLVKYIVKKIALADSADVFSLFVYHR